jgi:hypothetical protein
MLPVAALELDEVEPLLSLPQATRANALTAAIPQTATPRLLIFT